MSGVRTIAAAEREFQRFIAVDQIGRMDPLEAAASPYFTEEPIPLSYWLTDSRFIGPLHLSEEQMTAVSLAERIYFEPTMGLECLDWPKIRSVFDIRLAWGKGSGKDFISRVVLSRVAYLLLCLDSPQQYYGMPGTESIHITNVATAAPQAKNIFFTPWVKMLKGSPWFRARMEPLAREIEFEKGILATSGHSKVESQEGQNLLVAIIDEISGFKTAAELAKRRKEQDREPEGSAEGIYKTLQSSIRSRFPLTGKLLSISFTRFKNDMIDSLVKQGHVDMEQRGEKSRVYASRAATWDVNPLRRRSDFDEDYETDPLDAKCRYECQPEASPHRFFQNLYAVRSVLGVDPGETWEVKPDKITVPIEYWYGRDPTMGPNAPDTWNVRFDLSHLRPHRQPLAIHMDLGISSDLAGVAGSRVSGWRDEEEMFENPITGQIETRTIRRPEVTTDFVVTFEQQQADPVRGVPGSDIQIRWIRQLVMELQQRGWRIGLFTADGYQSTDTFQEMQRAGIDAELYSLDRKTEGYDILKSLIYAQLVRAPWSQLLYSEIESLVKLTDKKIDHQAGMSKDAADAWAGSVRGALYLLEQGKGYAPAGAMWGGGVIEDVLQSASERRIRLQGLSRFFDGSEEQRGSDQPQRRSEGTPAGGDSPHWSGGPVDV